MILVDILLLLTHNLLGFFIIDLLDLVDFMLYFLFHLLPVKILFDCAENLMNVDGLDRNLFETVITLYRLSFAGDLVVVYFLEVDHLFAFLALYL